MGRYYSDYLIHSSGPWKKHKYNRKERRKKGWIYYYDSRKDARDAGDYNEDGVSDWKDTVITLNPFDRRGNKYSNDYSRFEDWLGMDEQEAADIGKDMVDLGKRFVDRAQKDYDYDKERFDRSKNKDELWENKKQLDIAEDILNLEKEQQSRREARYEQSRKAYRRTPIGLLDFRYRKNS